MVENSLESKAKTSMQIMAMAVFIQKDEMGITMMDEEMLDGKTPNTKWVPLEDAIKAVFNKNLERFAEIKVLEDELTLFKTPDINLAKKIDHTVLANYLTSLKWIDRGDIHGKNIVTFQWIECTKTATTETTTLLYQISIPFSPHFSDFDSSVIIAANELALFLKQERKQVLVNLVFASLLNKEKKL